MENPQDVLASQLQGSAQELRLLQQYVENQRHLSANDRSYCQQRVKSVMRQLKVLERLLARVHDEAPSIALFQCCWN